MLGMDRGLLLAASIGVMALQPGEVRVSRIGSAAEGRYKRSAIEHYLTSDQLAYVRPGLNLTVNGITIDSDGKAVVDLSFTDDMGQPLDRNGQVTPGAITAEFILGQWDAARYDYVNLTSIAFAPGAPPTPLHDVGGTWTDLALGHSVYTFAIPLPSGYDPTQTVTLGIYAGRSTSDIVGKDYIAPAVITPFRPDGGAPSGGFAAIDTSACNTCHNPLSMHGQFGPPVQDVRLCVMCHTSQMPITQTNQSLEFKILIHKLHDGANLPSVQAGTPYAVAPGTDFSTVVFPQDIRNCTTCHTSSSATDAAIWLNRPSGAACGSCHDDVDFTAGTNHMGGPQINDSSCTNCHEPDQSAEYDPSIPGAHTIEYKSQQLHGLAMQILSVAQAAAGQKPVVTFQVKDKNGVSIDPRQFDTLQFTMGGSTTDYGTLPISENALASVTFDGTNATYAFQHAIPANATGTWAMSSDVEWTVPLHRGDGQPDITSFTETPMNPIYYMPITDAQATPRREAVDLDSCNTCHDRLSAHGGRRINTQECVICHNPINDDSSQRPADQAPAESVSFQRMIHRIHKGETLTNDFTIYGHGGRAANFNGLRFPGDLRDCEKCHVPGAEVPPDNARPGALPTVTLRDYYTPMQPNAAACLGCHDTQAAANHAVTNTAPFGEACAACHGANGDLAVEKVHAR